MMWQWGGWGGAGPGWWLIHALFWLVLIWGAIYLLRGTRRHTRDDKSEIILRERYAKGEISKEDFDRVKRELREP